MDENINFEDDEQSKGESLLSVILIIMTVSIIVGVYYLGVKSSANKNASHNENDEKVLGVYDERNSSPNAEYKYIEKEYKLINIDVPENLDYDVSNKFDEFYADMFTSKYNIENLELLSTDKNRDIILMVNKFRINKGISSVKYAEELSKFYKMKGIYMEVFDKIDIQKNLFEYMANYNCKGKNYQSYEKIIIMPKLDGVTEGYQVSVWINQQKYDQYRKLQKNIIESIRF